MEEPTVTVGDPEAGTPPPPPPADARGVYYELGQAMEAIAQLRQEVADCQAETNRLSGAVADLAGTLSQTREELAAVIVEEVQQEAEIHQETRARWHERMLGAGA